MAESSKEDKEYNAYLEVITNNRNDVMSIAILYGRYGYKQETHTKHTAYEFHKKIFLDYLWPLYQSCCNPQTAFPQELCTLGIAREWDNQAKLAEKIIYFLDFFAFGVGAIADACSDVLRHERQTLKEINDALVQWVFLQNPTLEEHNKHQNMTLFAIILGWETLYAIWALSGQVSEKKAKEMYLSMLQRLKDYLPKTQRKAKPRAQCKQSRISADTLIATQKVFRAWFQKPHPHLRARIWSLYLHLASEEAEPYDTKNPEIRQAFLQKIQKVLRIAKGPDEVKNEIKKSLDSLAHRANDPQHQPGEWGRGGAGSGRSPQRYYVFGLSFAQDFFELLRNAKINTKHQAILAESTLLSLPANAGNAKSKQRHHRSAELYEFLSGNFPVCQAIMALTQTLGNGHWAKFWQSQEDQKEPRA